VGLLDKLKETFKAEPKQLETFSGEGEYLHVNTNPEGFNIQAKRPANITSSAGQVFGDALYMSDKNDRKWFSPEGLASSMTAESGPVQSVHKIKANFNNALLVTPDNVYKVADAVKSNGGDFNKFLQQSDYDGLIIRGFDDLGQNIADKMYDDLSPLNMEYVTQDQVVNFKPAENIIETSSVNPRDYNKALMTASEEADYERLMNKDVKGEPMWIDKADPTSWSFDEKAPDYFNEPELVEYKPSVKSPYRQAMRASSDALRKVDAKMVGKTLGIAGLPFLFMNAQDTYASGIEQGDSPLKASARAGLEFALDAVSPFGLESPEVGKGSDVVNPSQPYFKQEGINYEDLLKTGFESTIK
jgi:hypothetical protein